MKHKIVEQKKVLEGFFEIDLFKVDYDRFDGGKLTNIPRYNISRPEAVAVLIENVDTKKLVLVEQFRFSATRRLDCNGWIVEVVAGLIDEGESPEEAARREVMEESGYRLQDLELVTKYHPSIGISDELVHLYYAKVKTEDRIEEGGGLEDESEDVKVLDLTYEELNQRFLDGKLVDAKTIIAMQWYGLKKLNS